MKRWFIEKNSKIVGSKIGYETKKDAIDDVRNISFKKWLEFSKQFPIFVKYPNKEQSGMYFEFDRWEDSFHQREYDAGSRYELIQSLFNEKVWLKYVHKTYNFVQKEFNIVFV